jgi:hypothetical protein
VTVLSELIGTSRDSSRRASNSGDDPRFRAKPSAKSLSEFHPRKSLSLISSKFLRSTWLKINVKLFLGQYLQTSAQLFKILKSEDHEAGPSLKVCSTYDLICCSFIYENLHILLHLSRKYQDIHIQVYFHVLSVYCHRRSRTFL